MIRPIVAALVAIALAGCGDSGRMYVGHYHDSFMGPHPKYYDLDGRQVDGKNGIRNGYVHEIAPTDVGSAGGMWVWTRVTDGQATRVEPASLPQALRVSQKTP